MSKETNNELYAKIMEKLSSIVGKKEDVAEVTEEVQEVVLSEEVAEVTEEVVEVAEEVALSEVEYVTEELFNEKLTELTSIVSDMANAFGDKEAKLEEKVTELSAEPAASAVVHSPDAAQEQVKNYQFGANKTQSTRERVMNRISQL